MSTVASEPVRVDKGLKRDSVGLLASIVLALSSVAPAFADDHVGSDLERLRRDPALGATAPWTRWRRR